MVSSARKRGLFPAFLYVYVADADASFARALVAGAVTLEEPLDTPYGDRRAMVRDPFGNVSQILHRRQTVRSCGGAFPSIDRRSCRLGLERFCHRLPGADPRWQDGQPGHRDERPECGGGEPRRRWQGPSVDGGLEQQETEGDAEDGTREC
jgi:hypothetical protein